MNDSTVLCHECHLPHIVRELSSGQCAFCGRCGAHLYEAHTDHVDWPLSLVFTGLILFVAANSFTFMTFAMEGREQTNKLFSGALEFWHAGYGELAVLVFLASICLPLLSLLAMLYLLLPLKLNRVPWKAIPALRLVIALKPWAMMEVYMIGVIVAIVKLMDFADIDLGYGFYAFIALIVAVTAANVSLKPQSIWQKIGRADFNPAIGDHDSTDTLGSCHSCSHVMPHNHDHWIGGKCPRCDAALHHRKPNSISRAWALLIAAIILYVPANVYPIMTVVSFGQGAPDTIVSGVVHLIEANQWPIAILVFFASVFVPMLKITVIAFLLISVQMGSRWWPRQRTVAYRLTEIFGRWSMIDIFMISILVALVKLDAIATIEAGLGAVAFAMVVILTMLSAMCFDPRLIWDTAEQEDG